MSENADARRKTQQGWAPCEHFQRGRRVFESKDCHEMNCEQTLTPVDNFVDNYQTTKGRLKNTFRRPFDIYIIINLFIIFCLILLIKKTIA